MLGWTVSLAGGSIDTPKRAVDIKGSKRAWVIAKFFFLGLASCGTFISNAADVQRYVRKPNEVYLGCLFGFPVSDLIISIMGNVIACASQSIFGEVCFPSISRYKLLLTYRVAYLEPLDFFEQTDGRRASHIC